MRRARSKARRLRRRMSNRLPESESIPPQAYAARNGADRPNLFAPVSGGFFLDGAAATDSLTLLLMNPGCILLCLLGIVGWCVSGQAQADTLKSEPLARSTQTIVVIT